VLEKVREKSKNQAIEVMAATVEIDAGYSVFTV
jgi:hypothetical protein